MLAHTISCPLTQLSGGVFVKLFKANCRETEGGERVGVEEARSDLLGTICIHREEELICAEGQSTYRICDMAPYRGGNNFSTLVPLFPELLVLDAREAWMCSLLSVWVRQAWKATCTADGGQMQHLIQCCAGWYTWSLTPCQLCSVAKPNHINQAQWLEFCSFTSSHPASPPFQGNENFNNKDCCLKYSQVTLKACKGKDAQFPLQIFS